MATQDLMISLFGAYEPTGVYSFEFRTLTGESKAEILFLLPPESTTVDEPQRSVLLPTLKGGYYVDYGNDFKEIKISGSTHFYYGGSGKGQSKEYGSTNNIGVEGYIDGFTEFIKLRYMLSRYRDYTLTNDGKITAPDFATREVSNVNALKLWARKLVDDGDGALADQVSVIYHNYDKDDHFFVRVDRFTSSEDKSDPWSVKYDISLEAYAVDTRKSGRIVIQQPNRQKPTAPQLFTGGGLLMGNLHQYSVPDSVLIVNPGKAYTVPVFKGSEIEDPPTHISIEGL